MNRSRPLEKKNEKLNFKYVCQERHLVRWWYGWFQSLDVSVKPVQGYKPLVTAWVINLNLTMVGVWGRVFCWKVLSGFLYGSRSTHLLDKTKTNRSRQSCDNSLQTRDINPMVLGPKFKSDQVVWHRPMSSLTGGDECASLWSNKITFKIDREVVWHADTFNPDLLHILAKLPAQFLVSAWFWVDKFMSHVFRSEWPIFDLRIQNGYAYSNYDNYTSYYIAGCSSNSKKMIHT